MKYGKCVMASILAFSIGITAETGAAYAAQPAAKNELSSKRVTVQIAEFRIVDGNGKAQFHMDGKGAVTLPDGSRINASKTGRITDSKGKLLAKLDNRSRLVNQKGEILTKVLADGTIDTGSGNLVRWLDDGQFSENEEIKIVPANSPSRQIASILLFLHASIGTVETTEVTEKK